MAERVITVVGKLEQQLRATALVLTKMAEDSHYDPDAVPMQYALPPHMPGMGGHGMGGHMAHHAMAMAGRPGHPMAGHHPHSPQHHPHHPHSPYMHMPGLPMGGRGHAPMPPHHPMAGMPMAGYGPPTPVEKILGVADEHVGAIVGKGGRALGELQQVSSTRVTLSGRGEFLPGTNQRMLTISGFPANIAMAERMIEDKIAESVRLAAQRAAGDRGGGHN